MNGLKILSITLAALSFISCTNGDKQASMQGYVEGEFVNIAPIFSGKVEKLYVQKGQIVQKGAQLFGLDSNGETNALNEAKERYQNALFNLENLRKGARKEEIEGAKERLKQAEINAENLLKQALRNEELYKANSLSKLELDNSVAAANIAKAAVSEAKNALLTLTLPAREDVIKASEALAKQAEHALKEAKRKLDEKNSYAPAEALVYDTIFREGEFAQAGAVVVRLLPKENLKIRFFISVKEAQTLKLGQSVYFETAGVKKEAKVTYISNKAEYTPPLIYSNESNERLVFMAEASVAPNDAATLHPGAPVKVFYDASK